MAFKTGTQVDPRLLNYGGYAQGMTNASTIQSQAIADLGNRVGEAIGEFKAKKDDKAIKTGLQGLLKGNPEFAETLGIKGTPSAGPDGQLVVTQPTDEDFKVGADTIFKMFGRDASKVFYGQALLSSFDDDDDDELYDPKKIDAFVKSVESESLKDLYKIKDNKLFRRVKGGKDEQINVGDVDQILEVDGAEEFLKLGVDPRGFFSE